MYKSIMFPAWLIALVLQQPAASIAGEADNPRPDVANGQAIYTQGKGDAMACGNCHGDKALGMDAMEAPRLANIGQLYLIKQLNDYASGKRTDPGNGAVMNDIAKALNAQDSLDVAAYLDNLEYATEPSDLKALAAEGQKTGSPPRIGDPKQGKIIMTKGIKGISPACKDCHGLSGRAQNIAAIHQQKYAYLVNQLKRYRDGRRANDREVLKVGIMRGIAKKLSDENIADISAYLSTVTELTP